MVLNNKSIEGEFFKVFFKEVKTLNMILIFLLSLPLYLSQTVFVKIGGAYLVAVAFLVFVLCCQSVRNCLIIKKVPGYTLLAFSLWMIPSCYILVFYAIAPLVSLVYTIIPAVILIYCVLLVSLLFKKGELSRFVNLNVIMFVVFNGFCLLLYFYDNQLFSDLYKRDQFSGIYNNRNVLGVVGVLFLCVWVVYQYGKVTSGFWYLVQIPMVVLVVASSSVKGMIGVVLVYLLFFITTWRLKITYFRLAIVFVSVVVILMSGVADNSLERLYGHLSIFTNNAERSGSSLEREWLVENGFKLFLDNSLTGVGIHNSQFYLYSPFRESYGGCGFPCGGTYTHNNYLEILVSIGVFGFLLYYIPYGYVFLYLSFFLIKEKSSSAKNTAFGLMCLTLFFDVAMVSYFSLFKSLFVVIAVFLTFEAEVRKLKFSNPI